MKKIQVTLIQTDANFSTKQEMLEEIETLIYNNSDSDLICLPELFCSIINLNNIDETAETECGIIFQTLSQAAKKIKAFIIGGILEKEGNKYYNTALLIDDTGKLIGKHRKICLNIFEDYILEKGGEVSTYDTKIGKIGIALGKDLNSLGICNKLASEEIDILVYLTQVPSPYQYIIEQTLISRAIELASYILVTSISGISNVTRLEFVGCTMVLQYSNLEEEKFCFDQEDFVISRLQTEGIGVLRIRLDIDKLKADREDSINIIRHKEINSILMNQL